MSLAAHAFRFLLMSIAALACADAFAQVPAAGALYDPTRLPVFHGTVQLFTLTPNGDIEGFVLTDGTEVKTPPHLTADLAAILRPGDRITIHGLRAALLPLLQAMSIENDATGAKVVDMGPDPGRRPAPPHWDTASPTRIEGRVRMLLHGPRGDVNGALLQSGVVLRLPPPEAARFTAVLVPGNAIEAEGLRRATPFGGFIDLTTLGPDGGPLEAIGGRPRPGPTLAMPPPDPRPH